LASGLIPINKEEKAALASTGAAFSSI